MDNLILVTYGLMILCSFVSFQVSAYKKTEFYDIGYIFSTSLLCLVVWSYYSKHQIVSSKSEAIFSIIFLVACIIIALIDISLESFNKSTFVIDNIMYVRPLIDLIEEEGKLKYRIIVAYDLSLEMLSKNESESLLFYNVKTKNYDKKGTIFENKSDARKQWKELKEKHNQIKNNMQ